MLAGVQIHRMIIYPSFLTVDLFPLTAVTDFNPDEALVEVCVRKFIFTFSKTTRPDKRV